MLRITGKLRTYSQVRCFFDNSAIVNASSTSENNMLRILLWAVLIIFLIGLLVVTGVLKMIF